MTKTISAIHWALIKAIYFFKKYFVAIGNQMVSSCVNFFYLIYLIKVLTPESFGFYSLGFALVVAGSSILQGMFQVQVITIIPKKTINEREIFASASFLLQLFACLVMLFVTLPFGLFFADNHQGTDIFMAVVVAFSALGAKEFFIRYLFATKDKHGPILVVNLVFLVALSIFCVVFPTIASAQSALLFLGMANAISASVGLYLSGIRFKGLDFHRIKTVWREIKVGGRWAAASAVMHNVRASAHTFLVALLAGPIDVGVMNAARTVVTPATIFVPALSSILLPKMASAYASHGSSKVYSLALHASAALIVITILYSLALVLNWVTISDQVFGDGYPDVFLFVVLWCVYASILAVRNNLEWGLQSMQRFREVAVCNSLSSIAALIFVFFLTYFRGVEGAILGAIFGEIFSASVLFVLFIKKVRLSCEVEVAR